MFFWECLLTHRLCVVELVIAKVSGYEVGDFMATFGDAHLYLNHLEQVHEQLSREPFALPNLTMNDSVRVYLVFHLRTSILEDYQHHSAMSIGSKRQYNEIVNGIDLYVSE